MLRRKGGSVVSGTTCGVPRLVLLVSDSLQGVSCSPVGMLTRSDWFRLNTPSEVSTSNDRGAASLTTVPSISLSLIQTLLSVFKLFCSLASCLLSKFSFCLSFYTASFLATTVASITLGLRNSRMVGMFVLSLLLISSSAGLYPTCRGVAL